MDIVSYETAKALKDAGFPQPAPSVGQFWYMGQFMGFISGKRADTTQPAFSFMVINRLHVKTPEEISETMVYAPMPIDIMREIGRLYSLRLDRGVNGLYCKH